MEKLFMSAGVVTSIVLLIVGILKLPFKNFKKKHPNWYKAIFTFVSFGLSVLLVILDEFYILGGQLLSIDFAVLVCAVFAGVFCGYSGVYEGLGLKELVKRLIEKAKNAMEMSAHEKAKKYLYKVEDIENAIKILEERKTNQETQSEV